MCKRVLRTFWKEKRRGENKLLAKEMTTEEDRAEGVFFRERFFVTFKKLKIDARYFFPMMDTLKASKRDPCGNISHVRLWGS